MKKIIKRIFVTVLAVLLVAVIFVGTYAYKGYKGHGAGCNIVK